MDPIDQFAAEARRFEAWAHTTEADPKIAVREALKRIVTLYSAALELPPPYTDELDDCPDVERLSKEDKAKITVHLSIPMDYYSEIFNPLNAPPEEPVVASIADDILDIYGDVIPGLRAYDAGQRANALWEWGSHFWIHWGEHATGAIRALHAWLRENDWNDF